MTGTNKSKVYCKKTFGDVAHFWIEVRSYIASNEDSQISALAQPTNNFLTYKDVKVLICDFGNDNVAYLEEMMNLIFSELMSICKQICQTVRGDEINNIIGVFWGFMFQNSFSLVDK